MTSPQEQPEDPGTRRAARIELAALALGVILAFVVLRIAFGGQETAFEDLALGEATVGLYAEFGGAPIHCRGVDDAEQCLAGFRARARPAAALWFGNSQLHAVNRLREGEQNAPPILFRHLATRNVDLLTFSQPNANLQEHLVLFSYLRSRLPLRLLILPVVFDDVRDSGIRDSLLAALEDGATRDALERHDIGRRIMADNANMASGDLAALDETIQEYSETAINDWLTEHSQLWELRPEARGNLFAWLYQMRNRLFGINAQSVRRLIPGRYALNLEAAEAMLADAQSEGIDAVIYVVPLRDDFAIPYDHDEYARFQRDIEALGQRYGASYANLEKLVPAELWGSMVTRNTGGRKEIDFMHFQAGGHALLAEAVGELADERLAGGGR